MQDVIVYKHNAGIWCQCKDCICASVQFRGLVQILSEFIFRFEILFNSNKKFYIS